MIGWKVKPRRQLPRISSTAASSSLQLVSTQNISSLILRQESINLGNAQDRLVEGREFCLPTLLVIKQKYGEEPGNPARNMLRLSCVSAVRFLATLGIYNYPVFGMVTYGKYGLPCITWSIKGEDVSNCSLTHKIS